MNLTQKIARLEEMQRAERRAYREQQNNPPSSESPLPLSAGVSSAERDLIAAAREIVKRDRYNREAAECCMKQLMQDLDNGDRDYIKFLLYAAEALDRMSGGGDGYLKRLEYHLEQAGLRPSQNQEG